MTDRSMIYRLGMDVSAYMSGAARAAAATELLDERISDLGPSGAQAAAQTSVAAGVMAAAATRTGAAADTAAAQVDRSSAAQVAAHGRASAAARTSADQQAAAFADLARRVGDDLDVGGRDGGSRLAQGINQGLIRNSPMIAAGIGAAMAAGGPAVIAGAGLLFAGIGAVAVAQNEQVAASWRALGTQLRTGAVADAAVLVPTYVDAASDIGAAFERLRPQLREAFADSGPGVDAVTDGIIALAENAMPGLVRAVAAGQPVFDALEGFLADIGTGMTGFLDGISEHSGAAGAALAAIGDVVSEFLPALGTLVGNGAEVASVVLPMMASALAGVNDVLQIIAPVLPEVLTGFLAFKAVGAFTGPMTAFGNSLERTGKLGGGAGSAALRLAGALPVVGIVAAAAGAALADSARQAEEYRARLDGAWAAVERGGSAGDAARTAVDRYDEIGKKLGDRTVLGIEGIGAQMQRISGEAAAAARAQYESMSQLEQAQVDVTREQNDLNSAIDEYGIASPEAAAATGTLAFAQDKLATAQAAAQMATSGLTAAMAAQADQALILASSDLGYREALDQVQTAQEALTTAVRDHGAASEEADDAGRQLEQAFIAQAQAAGTLASDALPATTDELTRTAVASQAQLIELYKLRDEMGAAFPASLATSIAQLERTTGSMDRTTIAANIAAGQARDLGLSVTEIPGSKYVQIDAPTAAQQQQLRDLGYLVATLPNGQVVVTAATSGAEYALDQLTQTRYMTIIATTVAGSSSRAASVQSLARQTEMATGGVVRTYAGGGVELSPMRGGLAQVVGPNTWRVIGDRVRDDEAYIPLDRSARSMALLEYTADRMGRAMLPTGAAATSTVPAGGAVTSSGAVTASSTRTAPMRTRELTGGAPAATATGPVVVNVEGARLTGRLEMGTDGMLTLVDGRITDVLTYAGTRAS